MHGRTQFIRAVALAKTDPVPFIADPPPDDGHAATVRWAKRQFEQLQRVIDAQSQRIDALEAVVGADTWDRA